MLMQVEAAVAPLKSMSQSADGGIGHILCLVGIMLAAGSLGGLVNYFQAVEDGPRELKEGGTRIKPRMRRRIIIGIGAAFLVPLFLNMISSDLLLACKETPTKLLVFAGFCLVASISSSAFIRSMSDRLLEQAAQNAEEANRRVNEVKNDLEPIKAKSTEPETGVTPGNRQSSPVLMAPSLTISQKVLRGLCETGFAFRSIEGISESTGIARDKLEAILEGLAEEGLVRQTPTADGLRWCLTKKGREVEAGRQLGQDAEIIPMRTTEGEQEAVGSSGG